MSHETESTTGWLQGNETSVLIYFSEILIDLIETLIYFTFVEVTIWMKKQYLQFWKILESKENTLKDSPCIW